MEFLKEPILFTELKKYKVVDPDGDIVGTPIDVVFDQELNLHSFIIGGSFWEEFRERLGIIDDIDPVVPLNAIESLEENIIRINVDKDQLKHKLEEDVFPDNAVWYSQLKRKKVESEDGTKIGKIINLMLLPENQFGFLIGGSMLQELAESLGLIRDWDLFLNKHFITAINDDRIKVKVNKQDLPATLNSRLLDEQEVQRYFAALRGKEKQELVALRRYHRPAAASLGLQDVR